MRTISKRGFTLLACLALLGILGISPDWAANVHISPPMERTEPDSRFIQYTFPPGTAFQVLLQTPLDTKVNQEQDPVEAIMNQNLYLLAELVVPKNTRFTGSVTRLEKPIAGRDGIMYVRFDQILLSNGERLPIKAHVRTERPDHLWGGQVTQGTKPVLSTQRVWWLGEYNRITFAGPRAMGKDISFPPGEHWTLILEDPLVVVKAREED